MFGKHFSSMYTGSMVGSGAMKFAVWGYVLSHAMPTNDAGMQVELNPVILATILGENEKDVREAIEYLCAPDANSRTKDEDGRRLIRLGQFDYRVVNGMKYRTMRNQEARRAQNRDAQERYREKRKKKLPPLPGERAYNDAMDRGDEAYAATVSDQFLPEAKVIDGV